MMIPCEICHCSFPSRNQLFHHLRLDHGYDGCNDRTPEERSAASAAIRSTYDNRDHDAYYRKQAEEANVLTLAELEKAQECFRKPLPVAYRINRSLREDDLRTEMLRVLESKAPGLVPCPCFPSISRVATIPPREWSQEAQKLLMNAQDVGALQRQELCSMVPPLLLDIDHPSLTILDLCAAPGSKSLQILDQMNDLAYQNKLDNVDLGLPSGMLVCNDSNMKRLLTVVRRSRQQRRSCMVLSASDGRYFPTLRKFAGFKHKFDRILCDVPCSGDGTLKKMSATKWENWAVKGHLSLHKLQLRLLIRALAAVRKGGRVVYSTCSLDPIENEAVISSAIARMGGPSVYRIVKAPEKLTLDAEEHFVYSKGATSWVVPDPDFSAENSVTYRSWNEVPDPQRKRQILPTMFPPNTRVEATLDQGSTTSTGDVISERDLELFDQMLPNCCRILPQHLNSGGFFCAIIERVNPLYFPVCYPLLRGTKLDEESHHGRIYFPVESSSRIRALILRDKYRDEVHFEGVPTLEIAQKWLRKHGAFVEGRSDTCIALPDFKEIVDDDLLQIAEFSRSKRTARPLNGTVQKDPIYAAMFRPPPASMVNEFCDFFGLFARDIDAQKAGVFRFPVEQVVLIGKRNPLLTIVSQSCIKLTSGGAKFTPVESGLVICSVTMADTNFQPDAVSKWDSGSLEVVHGRFEVAGWSAESNNSVRTEIENFSLFDEGAELLGKCATKRVLQLTKNQCIQLLERSWIVMEDSNCHGESPSSIDLEYSSHATSNISSWKSGAIVAEFKYSEGDESPVQSLYLPCILRSPSGDGERRIELLSPDLKTSSWLQLLQLL